MTLADLSSFLWRQTDLQGLDNLSNKLVLDAKYVRNLAIVAFGPDMPAGGGIDQLGIDPDRVAGPPHTAFHRDTVSL
ncbi:MAG: hypothetical protein V3V97_10595 [Hyphomicrobiaceae bacterium]